MNPRTTLDFKTILKDWQHFQHRKLQLKMANKFPCSFNAEAAGLTIRHLQAMVSFITESGEQRLEFCNESGISITILLADLRGYNTEGSHIKLILRPEKMLGSPILEFQSQAVQALVLAQLESFSREMVGGVLTPPSTESD